MHPFQNSEHNTDEPSGTLFNYLAELILAIFEIAALIAFLTAILLTALYFTH